MSNQRGGVLIPFVGFLQLLNHEYIKIIDHLCFWDSLEEPWKDSYIKDFEKNPFGVSAQLMLTIKGYETFSKEFVFSLWIDLAKDKLFNIDKKRSPSTLIELYDYINDCENNIDNIQLKLEKIKYITEKVILDLEKELYYLYK